MFVYYKNCSLRSAQPKEEACQSSIIKNRHTVINARYLFKNPLTVKDNGHVKHQQSVRSQRVIKLYMGEGERELFSFFSFNSRTLGHSVKLVGHRFRAEREGLLYTKYNEHGEVTATVRVKQRWLS